MDCHRLRTGRGIIMYRAHIAKRHEPIRTDASLDQLVPKDHLVRKLDRHIDFSIVHRLCAPLYSNTGQPGIDPEILIKIILLGPLFNIRSVRQTIKEIETNLAYRWFLGLGMDEKIPDHSTISQAYRRRFAGTDVFRQIFEDIVGQAEAHGFISGRILITDSTHIRANANKKKFDKVEVEQVVGDVEDELLGRVNEERAKRGKKH